ncbi:MAG: gamma-carboxymuconolactone decarboxylase [Pseudomonadales bacterium]|nr:gamma-carboxymuconolactone decarboxylase [Pseudomonadales bacterium]
MSGDRREKGLAMMATLFGPPSGAGNPMPMPLQRYTTEHLFGDVWQQDDLSLQERSLATCTMLIALNRPEEMRVHFTGAKNIGIEREKLVGVIAHAAHYAGWPNSMAALRALNDVWPE